MENELISFDDNGMVRTPHGQWRWYHHDMKFLFEKKEENWIMNYDTAQRMKNEGYDLSKITKIVHCQTLEDPTHSPTAEEAKKLIEFQVRFCSFVSFFYFCGNYSNILYTSNISIFCFTATFSDSLLHDKLSNFFCIERSCMI